MANIIKHPVKNDADGAPTTGQLVEGEILLNAYSGRAFFKKTNPSDSIVEFLTDLSPISVAQEDTVPPAIMQAAARAAFAFPEKDVFNIH